MKLFERRVLLSLSQQQQWIYLYYNTMVKCQGRVPLSGGSWQTLIDSHEKKFPSPVFVSLTCRPLVVCFFFIWQDLKVLCHFFLQTRDLIVMTKVGCFRDGAVTLDECFKGLLCVQSLFFFPSFHLSTFFSGLWENNRRIPAKTSIIIPLVSGGEEGIRWINLTERQVKIPPEKDKRALDCKSLKWGLK